VKQRTRLLGVDFGTVRIGLAVTDAERRISSPLETWTRRGPEADTRYFRSLVEEEEIGAIVVGLPIHLSGHEGGKAREAQQFGRWLAEITALPVYYWDERFTTVQAEQFLLDAGLTKKRRKGRLDRVAAQILLQSYLEVGCPTDYQPGALDD
jgi:putative Holliday junction resolvase